MERAEFTALATDALAHLERRIGDLEHDDLDIQLGGDVLTLSFSDGTRYVINAHSAAGQIWMAAERTAWHFDYDAASERWVAARSDEELMATVARVLSDKLGQPVRL